MFDILEEPQQINREIYKQIRRLGGMKFIRAPNDYHKHEK